MLDFTRVLECKICGSLMNSDADSIVFRREYYRMLIEICVVWTVENRFQYE